MARIILFATTDLVSDQRVHRSSLTLFQEGHDVLTIGRRLPDTPKNISCKYRVKLFKMVFRKGFLFYFFFNVRIFFYLLFHRFDLVCSNDLDTLFGCKLGCFFKRKPLIYDSHEYFTETPELIDRPIVKGVWRMIERLCLKNIKYAYTVSQSIADEYNKKYGVKMEVIRNFPLKNENFGHKSVRPTIIYQGALNKGRGLELAIEMINYLPCYYLMIVGAGDLELKLRKRVIELNLYDRVEFRGRIPYEKLHDITSKAWMGISLEEDLGLSYRYALPNKLFDYVKAQIAVLVSDLPEMANIVERYDIGLVAYTRDPKELANMVAEFFENKDRREKTIDNLMVANNEFIWENEKPKFLELYKRALAG